MATDRPCDAAYAANVALIDQQIEQLARMPPDVLVAASTRLTAEAVELSQRGEGEVARVVLLAGRVVYAVRARVLGTPAERL